jgi:hypothetical protein
MKMKKLFLIIFALSMVMFAQYPQVPSGYGLIRDAAVTSTNDTLNSG